MTAKISGRSIVVITDDDSYTQQNASNYGGEEIATRSELTFAATIRKNGSSYYVTISNTDLRKMGLSDGDDVDIIVKLPKPPVKECD